MFCLLLSQEARQYSVNLNKESRQDAVNLNVNTNAEGDDVSHYSEIDKISPRGSSWSTWPEDLRNSSAAQTYVNVSGVEESASSFVVPIPPPPPSIGPNTSPSKPKSNCELARSMNELSLNSNSSANVTKKLDPGFLAELEKHLGEKEATKNTNSANSEENQELEGASYLRCSSQDKLRQGSTSIQQLSTVEDTTKSLSVIPVLKSPPHKKSKSPVTTIDRRASFSSTSSTSKVRNSWQSKSTNIQRPRPQDEQRMTESTTDAIVSQIWQQTQTLPQQQQNICLTDLATGCQTLTPVPVSQGNAKFQETVGNIAISSANNHDQHGPCNVTKAIFTQSQACSSNLNHSPNTTHINQGNINLLHETASNIAGSSTNEAQHGPSNVAKATFNQTQVCSANENYFQNPSNLDHGVFNLLQVAANSVTNDSQYNVTNTSKASLNQIQACPSTSSQNYNASSVALSLLQTPNHVSGASASEPSSYGSCNISKAASINQAQACPTTSQNYLQNQNSFGLHQICPQNVPMSSGASNVHKIAHIQNDLQHLKPATLLSEQVYAELKQTVCNFYDYILYIISENIFSSKLSNLKIIEIK